MDFSGGKKKPIFPAKEVSTRTYKMMEPKSSANKHNNSKLPLFYSLNQITLSYKGIRKFKGNLKKFKCCMKCDVSLVPSD